MRRRTIVLLAGWTILVVGATVGIVLWFDDDPVPAPGARLAIDDAVDPSTPRIEPSTLLRSIANDSGDFSGSEGCASIITEYGTDASIDDVVAVYENIGFVAKGQPAVVDDEGAVDPEGDLIRWIAEHPREGQGWRAVDIVVGGVAGRPGWATVIALYGCSANAATAPSPTG